MEVTRSEAVGQESHGTAEIHADKPNVREQPFRKTLVCLVRTT